MKWYGITDAHSTAREDGFISVDGQLVFSVLSINEDIDLWRALFLLPSTLVSLNLKIGCWLCCIHLLFIYLPIIPWLRGHFIFQLIWLHHLTIDDHFKKRCCRLSLSWPCCRSLESTCWWCRLIATTPSLPIYPTSFLDSLCLVQKPGQEIVNWSNYAVYLGSPWQNSIPPHIPIQLGIQIQTIQYS